MKQVGVRELRLLLSKYLRCVKRGEDVLITERGEIVARIVPASGDKNKDNVRSALLQLAEKGLILPPRKWEKPAGRPRRVRVKGSPFADAVMEGRR
jgi:prevent-host-death family protein